MTPARLSDTDDGQRWLKNFLPDDIPLATTLLDSLHFLSEDIFRAGLRQLLTEIIEEEATIAPMALYPVRPPPKSPDYVEPAPDRPYAPDDGSEHIVANIVAEVVRTYQGQRDVLALPSQIELRDRRCRTIVLVDDYFGSGDTITRYLDRWWANRTIRSWRSYRLIRFVLVTYACSPMAKRELTKNRLVDDLRVVEFGFDFESAAWSEAEIEAIRHLCRRYANNKALALGHKGSEGLLVMAHTVPNNLPQIFRNGRGPRKPWWGFFPPGYRRLSAEQLVALGNYRPGKALQTPAKRLENTSLIEAGTDPALGRSLLRLLGALQRGPRTDDRLMRELTLTIFELQNLIKFAGRLGLLDEGRQLTDAGRAELRHARLRADRGWFGLEGSTEPYYPQTLRGAREI